MTDGFEKPMLAYEDLLEIEALVRRLNEKERTPEQGRWRVENVPLTRTGRATGRLARIQLWLLDEAKARENGYLPEEEDL